MQHSGKSHPHVPSLDLSLLDRQENREHLITLLRSLAEAQTEIDAELPDDPILKLIKVSQLGLEQLKLNKSSFTSRSDVSSVSNRSRGSEKELRRLKREIVHQKRALENYEFFFKQPEVANTVNTALSKLNTLKCAFCHKFFMSQHYLDQHLVRRHPELAGSGAEQMKTTAPVAQNSFSSRQRQIEALNSTFLSQFESLQSTILSVNAQKAHLTQSLSDPSSEEGAKKLREAAALQSELNRLLEQQQRILSEQAMQIREIQMMQEQCASRASPPISRSESQQTSFFDRQSVGEAAFELLRSPRMDDVPVKVKAEGESTGRLADLQEGWKSDAVTKRRVNQSTESVSPEKVEISVQEEKPAIPVQSKVPMGLPPVSKPRKPSVKVTGDLDTIRMKVAQLKKTECTFPVLAGKYGDALKSIYPHTADAISAAKSSLSALLSSSKKPLCDPRSTDFFTVRASLEAQCDALTHPPVSLSTVFREGSLVHRTVSLYCSTDGKACASKLERQRESLLSLNYDDSVSFSIQWGDDDEESGEWRGFAPEDARRLGFFFR